MGEDTGHDAQDNQNAHGEGAAATQATQSAENGPAQEAASGSGSPHHRRWLVIAIIVIVVVCAVPFVLWSVSEQMQQDDAAAESEEDAELEAARDEIRAIYNVDNQTDIRADIDDDIASGTYTEDDPLVLDNPFGTDTLSWYVYFTTDDAVQVSYTVLGDDDAGIAAFSQTPYGGDAYATEHEFQVIGLIPGSENTVELTLTTESGESRTCTIEGTASELMGVEEEQLSVEEGTSTVDLADGLYTILGNDSSGLDFVYLYDNTGQIRGEIPIIGYRAHRLLFDDGLMYYSISTNKIAAVDRLGQVQAVYSTGSYELHHDYIFDGDGNLLVLATDTEADDASVEDRVIRVDLATGDVTEVLDLGDLFPDIKAEAELGDDGDLDWMHINAIQWLGDDSILLSSRETSTIIRISDLYGTPTIDYLLGDEAFWGDTAYADLLLDTEGEAFSGNAGQHCVTYLPDESLSDGQYYLLIFDNNFGTSESYPDMDWSELGDDVATSIPDGETSYYRCFLVDENAGTVELVDQFDVPFSGYVSSVQLAEGTLDGTIVVDSGLSGTFGEYDADGTLIRQFQMEIETMIYRVFKYSYEGYFFAG